MNIISYADEINALTAELTSIKSYVKRQLAAERYINVLWKFRGVAEVIDGVLLDYRFAAEESNLSESEKASVRQAVNAFGEIKLSIRDELGINY